MHVGAVRVVADCGGTLDVVLGDGRHPRGATHPDDPGAAVRSGIASLVVEKVEVLAHGTTVATNVVLEGPIARVAVFTTEGFTDVIEIDRQDGTSLYDPFANRPAPPLSRGRTVSVWRNAPQTTATSPRGSSSAVGRRRVSQPWGLAGGEPGSVGENWLFPDGDESRAERLLDQCSFTCSSRPVPQLRQSQRRVRTVGRFGVHAGINVWSNVGVRAGPKWYSAWRG